MYKILGLGIVFLTHIVFVSAANSCDKFLLPSKKSCIALAALHRDHDNKKGLNLIPKLAKEYKAELLELPGSNTATKREQLGNMVYDFFTTVCTTRKCADQKAIDEAHAHIIATLCDFRVQYGSWRRSHTHVLPNEKAQLEWLMSLDQRMDRDFQALYERIKDIDSPCVLEAKNPVTGMLMILCFFGKVSV